MEIFGRNAVLEYLRALKSGQGAELNVYENAHGKIIQVMLNEAARARVRVERRDKSFFSNLGPSSAHQGVVLTVTGDQAGAAQEGEDGLLARVAAERGVLVLLDQLEDPHNVGAIIRTAEALGAGGVAITGAHSAGVTPAVVKASAGATAHIPVIELSNAARFLDKAKDAGCWIIGSAGDGDAAAKGLGEFRPAVLVVGSEGAGMRRITVEKCDRVVRIPLKGKVSSLNASVAAGILLYELLGD
jgi:23S rRNA (guanosine2251-2'-O)-methyltransferase